MARTFQMGARMTLKDQFKGTISKIINSTRDFKKNVDSTNRSVKTYTDSMGRLRDAQGRYVASGNKASAMTRTWINANGKLTTSFSLVTRGIQAAAAAFGLYKAKNWLIDSNADMETYKNTLTVVLKNEKKAVEMLAWATKFAAQTPFEIPQIVEATTRMSAYGINAQKTMGIVGDMAAVMRKDLMQAVEAVADAQTGELERLKEFGITKKMIEDQAKVMKVTVTNNKGQITDQKAFNAVLFTLMEKRFKGGMAMQAKTWKGMLSNLKDFMGSMGRTLGAPVFEALKGQLQKVMDFTQKLNDNGTLGKWGKEAVKAVSMAGAAFNKVRTYITGLVSLIRQKFSQVYTSNKPFIDKLVGAFFAAVTWLKTSIPPVFNWLTGTGIPLLISGLSLVADWVLKISGWFTENSGWIGPLILGIAAAWGVYLGIGATALLYTKAVTLATKGWAMAQAALNVIMNMNPVGLIITGVGLLIGLIILLVKNWDTVVAVFKSGAQVVGTFFVNLWTGIKTTAINVFNSLLGFIKKWGLLALAVISGPFGMVAYVIYKNWDKVKALLSTAVVWIKDAFKGVGLGIAAVFKGLVSIIKAPVNFLIKAVNTLIEGLNGMDIKIPKWVPLIGGKQFTFNIKEIPYLAKGTKNWQGGPAYMNERGGELAILPGGSQVIPSDKTDKILEGKGGVNIQNLIGKLEIHQQPGEDSESFAQRVINILFEKLSNAAEIANNDEMGALVNG